MPVCELKKIEIKKVSSGDSLISTTNKKKYAKSSLFSDFLLHQLYQPSVD